MEPAIASEDVVNLATPLLSVAVPNFKINAVSGFVAKKVTVPVAVPPNCPDTVAVKVTASPNTEGFFDEANFVEDFALSTVWLSGFDRLPAKFNSPLYAAVIESVPTGSAVVVRLASPPLRAFVPSADLPLRNVTSSPFGGAPSLDPTFAVKVTGSP